MIGDPMTDKQRKFIDDLIKARAVPDEIAMGFWEEIGDGRTRKRASEIIEFLLTLPPKERPTANEVQTSNVFAEVPEGRYAILGTDGAHHFSKVNKGRPGTRWEGYTFVSVQGGPVDYPLRGYAEKQAVLAAISREPREALARYGQLLGHCGVCGLELTDETSRALGIGPICRGRP